MHYRLRPNSHHTIVYDHYRSCPLERLSSRAQYSYLSNSWWIFSVLKYILNLGTASRSRRTNPDEPPPTHPGQYLINCFLCAWFITGCVWVYRIYPPVLAEDQSEDPRYCNKLVYQFAFWLITSAYIFLGLFTSCICCFSIVVVMLKGDHWRFIQVKIF